MASYEWIEMRGKKILYMDITSKDIADLKEKIREYRREIDRQPLHSLLTITDVTRGSYDREMADALNTFARENEPYIKMTVILGASGLKRVLYEAVMRITGRKNMTAKDSKEEAIAFLLTQ